MIEKNQCCWKKLTLQVATAAAVIVHLQASIANAFTVPAATAATSRRGTGSLAQLQQQQHLYDCYRRPLLPCSNGSCLRPRTQLAVVTDIDVLLRGTNQDLEDLYLRSSSATEDDNSKKPLTAADIDPPPEKKTRKELANVPLDSLRTNKTLRRKRETIINNYSSAQQPRSRSSTMPGLKGTGARSDREIAYLAGVRAVEQNSGRKLKDTPDTRAKRRATNGEAMYKNSACVPDSLVQFADEIHREDRITRTEEICLGEKTQEAIRLQNLYGKLLDTLDREPTDEEWCAAAGKINMESIRQTIDDGLEAKNKLVTANLRMVQSVVNTYIRNGLGGQYNAGDMMQEGIVALIRAAEKFEPDRGWRFSTYALYWIRSSVKRTQIFQSRIVTVPQRLYENHKRLQRVEREMISELGRKPSLQELGDVVGMSELQVKRCRSAMEQRCYSLDRGITNSFKPMADSNGDTLYELVKSKSDDGEHNKIQRRLLREDLIETLNRHLEPAEVELLLLRYGLKDGPSRKLGGQPTIAELSEMVGLKPDKVRRIINKSLRHLKKAGNDEWLAFDREMQS